MCVPAIFNLAVVKKENCFELFILCPDTTDESLKFEEDLASLCKMKCWVTYQIQQSLQVTVNLAVTGLNSPDFLAHVTGSPEIDWALWLV